LPFWGDGELTYALVYAFHRVFLTQLQPLSNLLKRLTLTAKESVIVRHSLFFLWWEQIEQVLQIVLHLRTDAGGIHADTHQKGVKLT